MRWRKLTALRLAALARWLLISGVIGLGLGLPADLASQPVLPPRLPGNPPWFGPVPRPLPPPQPPPRRPPVLIFQPWLGLLPIAAAAAAAKRKRDQEEEEEMTPHQPTASETFEYKIIRSATGAFKHPAKFKAALEEEARAGWDLFEKLDCSRARLRRPIACRQMDAELTQVPYRTVIGVGQGAIILWVVGGVLVGIAVLLGGLALVLK